MLADQPVLLDLSKAFYSVHMGEMEKIILRYDTPPWDVNCHNYGIQKKDSVYIFVNTFIQSHTYDFF